MNGMQRDEQGEEASAGCGVRGKCMLAVAKGRKRARAQWREEKPVTEPSVAVMRRRCSPWKRIRNRRRGLERLESRLGCCRD